MTPTSALFRSILAMEARNQFRSGLSALYIGMPVFWILIARLLPESARPLVVLIGSYADPVLMGQIFTGAFLARERDQGLIEALAVSPLGAGGWLFARVLLIGIQGSFGGLILALGSGISFRPAVLVTGVFFAAVSGALIGLILARPFRDMMSYFVLGGIASALVSLPIAGNLVSPSVLWLIPGPGASGWMVLSSALGYPDGVPATMPVPPPAVLIIWTGLLFILARRIYNRGFFRRPGKGATA